MWQALLQPVHGGGIPTPLGGVVELKFTFKDGGAFDFHTHFERIKERRGPKGLIALDRTLLHSPPVADGW